MRTSREVLIPGRKTPLSEKIWELVRADAGASPKNESGESDERGDDATHI